MPHSATLIHQICELLRKEYDVALYDYVIEKVIPGTRMYPDVLIINRASGRRQCAVEIGYTRPEKLTAYRTKLKIPDVRWYDKQGVLHADVTEKTVKISLMLVPRDLMAVYHVLDQVRCLNDECLDVCVGNHEEEACPELCENCLTYSSCDVSTIIVTDRIKAFFPSFCDKCGSTWLASPEDEAFEIATTLDEMSPRDFGREFGSQTKMTWDQARQLVEDTYGIKLDYADGETLPGEAQEIMERHRTEIMHVATIAD